MRPDIVSCNAAITACQKTSTWTAALSLLWNLLRSCLQRLEPSVVTCGAAVDSCGRAAKWWASLLLLSRAGTASLEASAITLNSVLKACTACAASGWSRAVALLQELKTISLKPGRILHTTAVNACAQGLASETALGLLADFEKGDLRADVVMYSSVLAACAGLWVHALNLLEEMERKQLLATAVPMNCAIHCCSLAAKWKQATLLLEDMELRQIQADVVTYTAAIKACGAGGKWQKAVWLLHEARLKQLQPNLVTYNSALAACGHDGPGSPGSRWQQAASLLEEARAQLPVDVVSYNAVLSAMSSQAHWQHSVMLRASMYTAGIAEDLYTCTATVAQPFWKVGLLLLQEMPRRRPSMLATSYTAAMGASEKAFAWPMALSLFQELEERMVQNSLVTCNAAISSCEKGLRWRGALDLLARAKAQPSTIGFSAAMSACDRAGQTSQAMQLLQEFEARRLQPTDVFCSAALTVCQPLCLQWFCLGAQCRTYASQHICTFRFMLDPGITCYSSHTKPRMFCGVLRSTHAAPHVWSLVGYSREDSKRLLVMCDLESCTLRGYFFPFAVSGHLGGSTSCYSPVI